MQQKPLTLSLALASFCLLPLQVGAEAVKPGTELTPIGAEKAGNADNTIPAWEGGLTKPPSAHKKGTHYTDPFHDEKPLFVITPQNADQYKEKLTPGQLEMFKKYPSFRMPIFPTHRTAAFPEEVYEATAKNRSKTKLIDGGNGIENATMGFPFPQPENGQQVIWNHLLAYRGDTYGMNFVQVTPTRNGDYTLARMETEYDFVYGNLSKTEDQRESNKLLNFLQAFTAPPRLAGTVLLVHETINQVKQPRTSWVYSPGLRRVRLAPEVAYDNPAPSSDGLRTADDFSMFNGAIDRYEWKLIGKKEIFIPYNSYRLISPKLKYDDLVKPNHLNPEYTRYELHRVWIIEANLKPEFRNIYSKRVFYLDEDSWNITVADKYDTRGNLWRYTEAHNVQMYDVPVHYNMVSVQHDLQSGRYLALGLRNEEPVIWQPLQRTPGDYTPAKLRKRGVR